MKPFSCFSPTAWQAKAGTEDPETEHRGFIARQQRQLHTSGAKCGLCSEYLNNNWTATQWGKCDLCSEYLNNDWTATPEKRKQLLNPHQCHT